MANGFGSFYIGTSGLKSAQNALNTTANNLSNVDTAGYVRQQVLFTDMNYMTLKKTATNVNYQQSGLGVSIGDVVHARDIFLDKTYRQEAGRKEFYNVRAETATYVEDMLQELQGEEFGDSIADMWQAVQELSTNMADSTVQNLVLQKAELLLSRSQSIYSELKSYQSTLNDQVKEQVDTVNEIGNRIYELNLQIQKVEAGGVETAMTLRDERDYLLDQLGSYVNIDVTEDSTGFVYVDIEGVRFIDDNKCYNMDVYTDKSTGFYTPYWPQLSNLSDPDNPKYYNAFKTTGGYSTEANTDIGSIKSLLIVRGSKYGVSSDLDDEDSYSAVSTSILSLVEAQIDRLLNAVVTKINEAFSPNTEAGDDLDGTALYDADGNALLDEDGNQLTLSSSTLILDTANCAVGVDGELPPREIFVRDGCDRYTTAYDSEGNAYYIYNEEDPTDKSTCYTIGSLTINQELKNQITLMPAYENNGAVDTVAYDIGAKLAELFDTADLYVSPYDKNACTIETYYNRIITDLGTEGETCQTAAETLDGGLASIDSMRQQVIGVSSDEELTKMIKYQAAYNAASRFFTVISEMTELICTGLI
ncbi:MAG: flagellar hook-associated protein FlgK [Clostridiales bacterium]|nr:flagellar hook-associated protein FlgK [Clostridiales bacterium]